MGDFLWFLSGVNLILLSWDRLQRKKGGVGKEWIRRYCPELGAVLFIIGGVLKAFGLSG